MIDPFTGSLAYLFPKLKSWMKEERESLRQEITKSVGL